MANVITGFHWFPSWLIAFRSGFDSQTIFVFELLLLPTQFNGTRKMSIEQHKNKCKRERDRDRKWSRHETRNKKKDWRDWNGKTFHIWVGVSFEFLFILSMLLNILKFFFLFFKLELERAQQPYVHDLKYTQCLFVIRYFISIRSIWVDSRTWFTSVHCRVCGNYFGCACVSFSIFQWQSKNSRPLTL